MDNNLFINMDADFFEARKYFKKSIQFKAYELDGQVSGDTEHSHDYMQIWYVCAGICNHRLNNRECKMVKGDLFVIPPYVVHKVTPIDGEPIKILGVEFSTSFINGMFDNFARNKEFFDFAYLEPFLVSEDKVKPKLVLSYKSQTDMERIFNEIIDEYNKENRYYELFIKANLLKILAVVNREYSKSPENREQYEIFEKYRSGILDSIQYIKDNFNQDIRLDDICKYSMMSKTYFCYIFKTLTGKTFTEYCTDLRIKKSMELLTTTDMSTTDICFDVGYNDVTHFCRTFKKVVGVSPKLYRKSSLDKESF